MARLQIYDGEELIRDVQLGGERVRVGRDDGCTLVLEDPSVSRRHAEIEPNGTFYLVRDNGSTNGTFVNDMLVRVQLLSHGDVIRIGRYLVRVDARKATSKESTRVRIESLGLVGSSSSEVGLTDATVEFDPSMLDSDEGDAGDEGLSFDDPGGPRSILKSLRSLIGYVQDRDDLARQTLDFVVAALSGERAAFLLHDPSSEAGAAVRALATKTKEPADEGEIRIDDGLLQHALSSSEPVAFDLPDRSCGMLCPLVDQGQPRGVIYVDRPPDSAAFSESDRRLFELIGSQVTVSLANARLFEDLLDERSKVRAIFSSLTDGVLVTDTELRVTDANLAATVILGLAGVNPMNSTLFELFEGFHVVPDREVLRSEIAEGGGIFQLSRSADTGATERAVSGQVVPFTRHREGERGFVVILRDDTESRRLEQLKSSFIDNVAHKLRTPLTVIEANLPLLAEQVPAGSLANELVEEASRNSKRLCHIVDQFVDYTESELRAQETVPTLSSIRRVVDDAVESRKLEAQTYGIELEGFVPLDVALYVRPRRIGEALERVINNAIKFTGSGGSVVVDADVSPGLVRIHVTDDGPGIPAEQIESVFLVGHQVDDQKTGQVPGAGLGLAIVRKILQEHGGDVRVTSPSRDDGRGTRVSMLLPCGVQGLRSVDLEEETSHVH